LVFAQPLAAQTPDAATPSQDAEPAPAQAAPTQPASVTFTLELEAAGCATTAQDLSSAILARVPSAHRLDAEKPDVAFLAEVRSGGTSALQVSLAEGSSRREFPGVSCEEASAIIALIAALVLDARPEERLKATELAAVPEPPKPTDEDKKSEQPKPPAEPAPAVATTPDRGAGAPKTKPRFGVSAALALETAVARTPPFGGAFGIDLLWDKPSFIAPELRGELLVTGSSSQATQAGSVRLNLIAGRLSACPARLRFEGVASVTACATFDIGSLHAQGYPAGQLASMPWYAGGVAALGDIPLTRAVSVQLTAGARLLVNHDNFTLRQLDAQGAETGQIAVYRVPIYSADFGVGLAFRP
jgi:hypothetical protein